MDIRPNTSALIAKSLVVFFVLVMVAIFLMKPPLTSSTACVQEERVFENAIPENAPIRIKIKKEKEKSFKNLKDENWLREFELEVKNTGEKPIYFLFLDLITDVKVGGDRLVFSLVYGRAELGDIVSKAQPDDVPLKPGETYVFKIHPGQVPAWEQSVRNKSHPDASRLTPKIETVSFGDGTGYFLDKPYPRADKLRSALDDQTQPPNRGRPQTAGPPTGQRTQSAASSIFDLPVMSLPANFLFADWLQNTLSGSRQKAAGEH